MAETQRRATRDSTSQRYDEKAVSLDGVLAGYPDEADDSQVVENKKCEDWKNALGQVLVYSLISEKKPAITLIMKEDYMSKLPLIYRVYSHYGVDLYIVSEKDACNPVYDKKQNWRACLKLEELREIVEPISPEGISSKARKADLVRLAMDVRLDTLTLALLQKLAKAKSLSTSGTKAKLLAEVKKAWDDEKMLRLFKEQKDCPMIEPTLITKEKLDEIMQTVPTKINFRHMKHSQLRKYAKENGHVVPPYLSWEDLIAYLQDPSPDLLESLTKNCLAKGFEQMGVKQRALYAKEFGIDISHVEDSAEVVPILEAHHKKTGSKKPVPTPSKKQASSSTTDTSDFASMSRKDIVTLATEKGFRIPSKPYLGVDLLREFMKDPSQTRLDELIASLKEKE